MRSKKPIKRPEPMAVLRTAIGSSLNVRQKMQFVALLLGLLGLIPIGAARILRQPQASAAKEQDSLPQLVGYIGLVFLIAIPLSRYSLVLHYTWPLLMPIPFFAGAYILASSRNRLTLFIGLVDYVAPVVGAWVVLPSGI
jgi:hypothetical protein